MGAFFARRYDMVTQDTPDYSAGDLCGGKLSFQTRSPGSGWNLKRLALKSIDTFTGVASKLYLFDADPSATTFTENAAFSVNSADRSKLVEVIDIAAADWTDYTARTGLYIVRKAIEVPVLFASTDRILYGAFVPEATLNLSTIASIQAIIGGEIDQ